MKCAVVNSKDMNLTNCMSALRGTDSCEKCNRVEQCQLPEAKHGLVRFREQQVVRAENKLKYAQDILNATYQALEDAVEDRDSIN